MLPNAALRFKAAVTAKGKPTANTGNRVSDGEPRRAGKGKKRDSSTGTVYVDNGRKLRPVSIQIGITDNRSTEVVGGDLKPGDQVIAGENPVAANKPNGVGMRLF